MESRKFCRKDKSEEVKERPLLVTWNRAWAMNLGVVIPSRIVEKRVFHPKGERLAMRKKKERLTLVLTFK